MKQREIKSRYIGKVFRFDHKNVDVFLCPFCGSIEKIKLPFKDKCGKRHRWVGIGNKLDPSIKGEIVFCIRCGKIRES